LADQYEIIVVGGGIAGFSAALAAARLGRRTLVLTGDTLGGQLLNIEKVDGYPGFPEGVPGYDLCPIAQEQASEAGAEVVMASMTALERSGDSWAVTAGGTSYSAKCVILATGTELKALGVPGEASLRGKGVSHCASCDAPLLRGRPAVVAGGGDSALQEALTLAEHCSDVTIVHWGESFTGQVSYRALADANPKISSLANSEITEILGDEAVTAVRVRNTATDATQDLECAGAFIFVGLQPNTEFIEDNSILDDDRYIVTDAAMCTGLEGLLAAGTVRSNNAGRAAASAGDGATAAMTADRYLKSARWPG
jgi:thioredoxin reductase (NADPH)